VHSPSTRGATNCEEGEGATSITEAYENIRWLAPDFFTPVKQAVAQSHNKAQFERRVNKEIERLAQELGVNLVSREQYTLATGLTTKYSQIPANLC